MYLLIDFSDAEFARRKGSKDKKKRKATKSIGLYRGLKGSDWAKVGGLIATGVVGRRAIDYGLGGSIIHKPLVIGGTAAALGSLGGAAYVGNRVAKRLENEGYKVNSVNPFQKEQKLRR